MLNVQTTLIGKFMLIRLGWSKKALHSEYMLKKAKLMLPKVKFSAYLHNSYYV